MQKIGILGGGQLARMLALSAHTLSLSSAIVKKIMPSSASCSGIAGEL